MTRRRRSPLVAVAAALFAVSAIRAAPSPGFEPRGWARLVFLLEYVGTDYAGAVRGGSVADPFEYGEVLGFTRQIIRDHLAFGTEADPVGRGLRELEKLILDRAPAERVWSKTRQILPGLSAAIGGAARPAVAPSLATGGVLFRRDCAPCHGAAGAGDGPSVGGMDPPPITLRGEQLDLLSPRQVYGAVSFGIHGTAMPSFGTSYTEEQLWDVAFFVMTLRDGFAPREGPADAPPLALEEIAASSNRQLLLKLRETRSDAAPRDVDHYRAHYASSSGRSATRMAPHPGLAAALDLQDVFADVASRVFPGVVGVSGYVKDPDWTIEKLQAARGEGWTVANTDALRYPGFRPIRTGSGFLVDREGTVVSCDHLLRDERGQVVPLVDVELQDNVHRTASVVGTEPTLDLAVLRIAEPERIPETVGALELGDSDALRAGHWLIAASDPPGPEKSFTVGVVSAPPAQQCYQQQLTATLVQSALPLPAEGAGGPVVDIKGRVVGVSVRRARAEDARLPAILPVNLVSNLVAALKVAESDRSPWIGVSVLEIPLVRRRLGAKAGTVAFPRSGVYIEDVFDPSPASRAGIRPGDFLVGMGGHPVLEVPDFQKWLYVLGIGAQVELDLVRDGRPLKIAVMVEARPESATTR